MIFVYKYAQVFFVSIDSCGSIFPLLADLLLIYDKDEKNRIEKTLTSVFPSPIDE